MEILLIMIVFIVPFWRICKRAGFNPLMAVVTSIPLVGVAIVSAILAWKKWPLHHIPARKGGQ